jgi:hypothetical protein
MSWLRLMEESIKEDEFINTEENAAIIQPVTIPKKQGVAGLIKNMWPAYLIEIFVIILGISISLALEAWRDTVKEDHLEQIYLKNLRADIDVDLKNLNYVGARTQLLLNRGKELLDYTRNQAGNIRYNQVSEDIRAILNRPNFLSSDATFSDLKSSGNLHLVKDIQLKNLLFAYYSQAQNIREVQDAEQQATITLSGSYFLKYFSLDDSVSHTILADQKNISGVLNNVEFQNNVLLRVSNRKELLIDYQKGDSIAVQLKEALTKKIE